MDEKEKRREQGGKKAAKADAERNTGQTSPAPRRPAGDFAVDFVVLLRNRHFKATMVYLRCFYFILVGYFTSKTLNLHQNLRYSSKSQS